MKNYRSQRLKAQRGQGLTEYAVVLSLVALAAIFSVSILGGSLRGKFGELTGRITGNTATITEAQSRMGKSDTASQDESKRGNKGMQVDDSYNDKSIGISE